MPTPLHIARRLLSAALPLCVLCVTPYAAEPPVASDRKPDEARMWSFEEDAVGQVPTGWQVTETNGAGTLATWAVVNDATAPKPPNALALQETKNVGSTYNLLLAKDTSFADVVVSAKVKANEGEEDQGGGVVWRAKDANNYYIARWNPLENNFRVYAVNKGKRRMLATTDTKADPNAWHEVRVEMAGNRILASFDGQRFVETEDDSIADAGMVGLWTKADATTSFDDVSASLPADSPGEPATTGPVPTESRSGAPVQP